MTPFRGVGGRLALALLTVVVGVLAIVYLIIVPSFRRSLENTELNGLSRSMTKLAIYNFSGEYDTFQSFAEGLAPVVNARVLVLDLLASPGPLEPIADSSLEQSSSVFENDRVALKAVADKGLARGVVTRKGQSYAEVAYPTNGYVLLFSAPLHDQLQTVQVVERRFLVAGVIATAFAILVGYAGSTIFARRLRRLEAAAERIAAGDFDDPVIDAGDDEVGQLARAFERMRLRIATLDRARGEFIANASHELRTPLFSLAGFLELLDEPGLDAGRLAVQAETVDLPALAAELAAEFAPRAAAAGHELDVARAEPAEARADFERVLQIGRILVENALVHTPAGTAVRLETETEGGRAVLAVANDGPPIPADAQRQIFERFFRLDGTRASGSGLGLAIARELAEVMDGRIELETRDGWTRFALALPADLPAPKSVKTAQTPF